HKNRGEHGPGAIMDESGCDLEEVFGEARPATIRGAAPWAAPASSGRPVRVPGFAKVASMPAWEAGAAQGAAPRAPLKLSAHLRLAAIVGQVHNLVYNLPHKLSRKILELPNVW